ncbi:vomeronasal type-1 receptor 2 [Rattus norvegicus]|uniref:vomeronasal type-1 receptor 2 n=1 Tax=Rattus norvegicus TaxID=10116 RepID=UPI000049F1F5|eukprot:NP_001008962.1 vomeronasal 1 receptor 12 [Rattus norvegicus]
MDSKGLVVGVIFILQCSMGILRHLTLLTYYLMLHFNKHTLKPIDLILMNLFIANFLIIFPKSLLQTVETFGMKLLFSVFVCQFLLYIERVGRSVSVATVCLLSVFQAITISPRNSCLNGLKVKVPKHVNLSIFLCWALCFIVNMILPVYAYIKWSSNNMTYKRTLKYCFSVGHDEVTGSIFTILFVFPEVFLAILIVWSGISMVAILYRHKQQVQHIYCNYASTRTSPESRATKSIVVLVSVFICFYSVSSIMYGCIALFCDDSWWLLNIADIICLCFPILVSFVVSHNPALPRFSLFRIRNTGRV